MASLTLELFPLGYSYLTLEVGYSQFFFRLNEKEIIAERLPLVQRACETIWKIIGRWYFSRYNPKNVVLKTQKSLDNAIGQIGVVDHIAKIGGWYGALELRHLCGAYAFVSDAALEKIGPHLDSRIALLARRKKVVKALSWAKDATPINPPKVDEKDTLLWKALEELELKSKEEETEAGGGQKKQGVDEEGDVEME